MGFCFKKINKEDEVFFVEEKRQASENYTLRSAKCTKGTLPQRADMAKLADAQDLESCGQPCGFKSHYPHHKSPEGFPSGLFG